MCADRKVYWETVGEMIWMDVGDSIHFETNAEIRIKNDKITEHSEKTDQLYRPINMVRTFNNSKGD